MKYLLKLEKMFRSYNQDFTKTARLMSALDDILIMNEALSSDLQILQKSENVKSPGRITPKSLPISF